MNLFELAAVLTLNKADYDKGLDSAAKSASSIGSKIGGAMKTVGKITAGAVAAGAAAVTALVKQSTSAYGEYQQLVGGVETLFGESADTLMRYAKGAYKTAQISSNAYMNLVTSFSGAIIKSSRNQAEAAELSNIAIQDMADQANKYGKSVDEVGETYKSLARGNVMTLDNLFGGMFAGTKEGLAEMLETAENYRKSMGETVSYSKDSYADIVMAIHDISEMTGVAGTSVAEAGSTIQGSMASMKAAWKNLVVGLSDPTANLGVLISDVFEQATGALHNMIPTVTTVLKRIGPAVEKAIPDLVNLGVSLITDSLPDFLNAIMSLVTGVVDGIVNNADQILGTVASVIDDLVSYLSEGDIIGKIGTAAAKLIGKVVTVIAENIPAIMASFSTIIPALVDVLLNPEMITSLYDAGFSIVETLIQSAGDAIPMILERIPELYAQLTSSILDNANSLIDTAVEVITTLAQGLINPEALTSILNSALALIVGLAEGLIAAIPKLIPVALDIVMSLVEWITEPTTLSSIIIAAIDLIEALANGLIDSIGELAPAVVTVIMGLVNAFTDPEMLMEIIHVGQHLVISVIEGIIAAIPELLSTVPRMIGEFINKIVEHGADIKDAAVKIIGFFTEKISGKIEEIKNWGRNIISGFIGGILEKWENLKSKVTGIVNGIKNLFTGKGGFDTHSPSRWAKKVFENVLAGAEVGLDEDTGLMRSAKDVVGGVQNKLNMLASPSVTLGASAQQSMDGDEDGTPAIYALLLQYLPLLASLKVQLDSGALVGALTPDIDAELGRRSGNVRRGATV